MAEPGFHLQAALTQTVPELASCAHAYAVACQVATSNVLAMPFDWARLEYARAVRLGLIERSMLACANYARWLNALERLTLGPLARRY